MEKHTIKVRLNDKENLGSRIAVDAEVVQEKATCIWVKLPDGNIIRRKKSRDIVEVAGNTVA